MTEEELKQKFREDWFKGSEWSHNSNTALSIEKHSENYKLELKGYIDGYQLAQAEMLKEQANRVHTCHDQCQRLACVQRREIEKLKSDLKDYYLTQEKYKESYEYGLKLKDENEELKRFSDRQSDQYHVTRLKLEELKADTKMLIEALEEIKFYEDDFVKSSKETGTYYLRVVNEALTEWNKKRGEV